MYSTQMIPATFFGLDNLFDSFDDETKNSGKFMPRASVAEKDGVYTLEVELPGVKKGDLDVSVNGDTLSVKASRKSATSEMSYERSFRLAEDLDTDNVEASFEDGVLTFTLAKKKSAEARKLTIK